MVVKRKGLILLLVKKGGVDRYKADQADLAWRVARAEFATARAALTRTEKRLEEAMLGPERVRAKESEVAAATAQLARAEAQLAEVQSVLDENPEHRLSPGLPADAVIRWKEDAPWERPRW